MPCYSLSAKSRPVDLSELVIHLQTRRSRKCKFKNVIPREVGNIIKVEGTWIEGHPDQVSGNEIEYFVWEGGKNLLK